MRLNFWIIPLVKRAPEWTHSARRRRFGRRAGQRRKIRDCPLRPPSVRRDVECAMPKTMSSGQPDPSDPDPLPRSPALPGQRRRPSIAERVKRSPVTFAILAVNIAVFLLAERDGNTLRTNTLLRFGADEQFLVR